MQLKGELNWVSGELNWALLLTPAELRIVISALRDTLIDEKDHKDVALSLAEDISTDRRNLTNQLSDEVEKQYSAVKSILSTD